MSMRRIKKKQKPKPILIEESHFYDDESVESSGNIIYQRQNIFNELDLIKSRVNQVIVNYEESGPTASYTNEGMDHVKNLISKYEENRTQNKAALTAVNNFCRAQLERFEEFNAEYSLNEPPSELLKDIQHHEFKNAQDVAQKAVDKLKSIMTKLSSESKNPLESSGIVEDTKERHDKSAQRRKSLIVKSNYTNAYLENFKLKTENSTQQKELKSIKAAYNELLSEREKSVDAIGEVNRLKRELNQAHKEVEALQRNLKMQQSKEHRRKPTAYYDGAYNEEIPNVYTQETLVQQSASRNWEKTIAKDRRMSTTMAYSTISHKKEAPTAKQKSYSNVSDSSTCSSSASIDDLSFSKKHEDKLYNHVYDINGAQIKEVNKYKNKSDELRKNIPPSNRNSTKLQPVSNLKSEDRKNNKATVSSQPKIGSALPDINSPKTQHSNTENSLHHKPRDPVKLPEIDLRPGNDHNLSKQPSSSEVITKALLDLCDKEQLTIQKIKEDHKDTLNALIKEPVDGLSEEEQIDKAAKVTVEYVNMSQSINKIGQILKEHCEQDNQEYQIGVALTEEESRNAITKYYSGFVESMISTVNSVDKEMQRDGIFGGEVLTRALKSQQFDSHCLSMPSEQSKCTDFITIITNALETISYNCKLYLKQTEQSISDQEKRLSSLQKANPQVYQKCIKQLEKASQLPHFIDKSIQKGSQQICSMLENHIVKIQSAIQAFNYKRELLTMETKSKIQSHVQEIAKDTDKISSLCVEDGRHDAMVDGLQSSVRQLNKLCKRLQIMQGNSAKEDSTTEKAPSSFLEQSKSAITEVQGQVKNIVSSKLGVEMPDQFDFEVTGKSIYSAVKQPTAVLPALSNNKCVQNFTDQSCNEPLHSGQPSVSSDGQKSSRFNTSRRNSVLDPLLFHSPLVTAVDLESSTLANGIKGVTVCKQINDDRPVTALKGNTQSKNRSRLARLHINDWERRKSHQDNMRVKFTISNESIKKHGSDTRADPLECFKITSLSHKSNKP